jgi:general secretion pathway protein D
MASGMNFKVGLTFAVGLLIAGCGMQPMKPSPGHVQAVAPAPAGEIPEPVRITPILPKPKPAARPETYSVVVNNVRVQELLFALARDAKLNIDIHSGIVGSVTLNAIDQTLQQLLARIAKQVDMRYELDGPNLAVMPDTPYLRNYKIDYVNMQRDTTNSVGTSTQVATPGAAGAGGGGGAAGGNQSTTSIRSTATNHFWDTLVKNVQDILHETDKILPAPGQAGAATPAAAPVAAPATQPGGAGAAGAAPAASATPAQQGASFREAASVISNPESGILTIRATSRQHEKIQEFLDQVLSSANRQVLIEATIAEVQLNNQYQQGIDWSAACPTGRCTTGFTLNQSASGTTTASPTGSIFVLNYAAPHFSNLLATVRLLDSFGNVRVLSSPRLTVLNNQTAILKVVDNQVYFTIQATTTAGSAGVAPVTTFTTTPNVVAVGFIMNVTPQIGDADSVLLNVRPSISRIVGNVPDPNPTLAAPCGASSVGVASGAACGPITSNIPVIQTREMESLIKVNSGQIAVMGGLIQDRINDLQDSVPGVDRIPGIGRLFENKNLTNTKTELVVFMRPIIIRDASIDGDYRGYRTYLPDDKFMAAPNPGKPPPLGEAKGASR